MEVSVVNAAKVFLPTIVAFFLGIGMTPLLTHYLYKYKLWKKTARNDGLGGGGTPLFTELHKERETKTPRMGGIIIWIATTATIGLFWLLWTAFPTSTTEKLNFFSRSQTWLPLFTLISASLVGLVDDILVVRGAGSYIGGGLSLRARIAVVLLIGAIGGWWFFTKLGVSAITIPFLGVLPLGIFLVPFFMLVMLALFAGGVIDGIDGLAGGVMAAPFAAYAGIAFFQNQIDLAAFCAVVTGALLAFLWFNIPPARFYMSETGMLGLTTTLAVVAFLTDAVAVLPLIAFLPFAAAGSDVVQILSKKYRGKKVFRIAPIHHHFEAIGWPPEKVTMRFWVLGVIFAILGMVIALVG